MLGGATAGMQAVKCRDLHRYRVEALNLYKTQCARQKPREDTLAVQGATSLHIPRVSRVSPAGGDTGQGWENVSTQLSSHDTRPTFTRE